MLIKDFSPFEFDLNTFLRIGSLLDFAFMNSWRQFKNAKPSLAILIIFA